MVLIESVKIYDKYNYKYYYKGYEDTLEDLIVVRIFSVHMETWIKSKNYGFDTASDK